MQMYDVVICFLYLLDDIQNKLKKEKEMNGRVPIFFATDNSLKKFLKTQGKVCFSFPRYWGKFSFGHPILMKKTKIKKSMFSTNFFSQNR